MLGEAFCRAAWMCRRTLQVEHTQVLGAATAAVAAAAAAPVMFEQPLQCS